MNNSKSKRNISSAARKRISQAQKQRWAIWKENKNKTKVIHMHPPAPTPLISQNQQVNAFRFLNERVKIYETPMEAYVDGYLEGHQAGYEAGYKDRQKEA